MLDELLALLTPDALMLLAIFVGAFIIGVAILVCLIYLARYFGWLF